MKASITKTRLLALLTLAIIGLMTTAMFSTVSAATITSKHFEGKGAIAQWIIDTPTGPHPINAIIDMTNSEKNPEIYVSISHPSRGISAGSGPANITWSMNHVTVEAVVTFDVVIPGSSPGRTGSHNISITWQTNGPTTNKPLTVNTMHGLTALIDGASKHAEAKLTLDSTATSGHHQDDVFTSSWATVMHGTADIALTS